jgi:hypothetical protein
LQPLFSCAVATISGVSATTFTAVGPFRPDFFIDHLLLFLQPIFLFGCQLPPFRLLFLMSPILAVGGRARTWRLEWCAVVFVVFRSPDVTVHHVADGVDR